MRFAAFSYAYSTNLGDEIQTLAAAQYLPRIDVLIERDRLNFYDGVPSLFVIFNGWFAQPHSWPPPDSLAPLFVSFHAAFPDSLAAPGFAGYFKRHEPIGCRDLVTAEAFRKIGIDAYFSGCLTLTLRRPAVPRTDRIYAVDVEPDLFAAVVPDAVRKEAVFITHEHPASESPKIAWGPDLALRGLYKWEGGRFLLKGMGEGLNKARHAVRAQKAEELLARYSAAKLVITSRLHCALPCVALGTPVILLRRGVEADPRFAGLRDFVRFQSDGSRRAVIDWRNPEPNPDKHLTYAKALRERCEGAVRRAMSRGSNLRSRE